MDTETSRRQTPIVAAPRSPWSRLRTFARRHVWRWLILIVGGALVVAGVAMLALPGPGLLVLFAGLAVLATEFEAARRAQRWVRSKARRTWGRLRHGDELRRPSEGTDPTGPAPPIL